MSGQFLRYAAAAVLATTMTVPAFAQQNTSEPAGGHPQMIACPGVEDTFLGMVVEHMPEPVGGFEEFITAINRSIRYPDGLAEGGKVYIAFVVDTSGRLKDFSVIRGFHPDADREALRVLKALDYRFRPALQHGKRVAARFVMPIAFKEKK